MPVKYPFVASRPSPLAARLYTTIVYRLHPLHGGLPCLVCNVFLFPVFSSSSSWAPWSSSSAPIVDKSTCHSKKDKQSTARSWIWNWKSPFPVGFKIDGLLWIWTKRWHGKSPRFNLAGPICSCISGCKRPTKIALTRRWHFFDFFFEKKTELWPGTLESGNFDG